MSTSKEVQKFIADAIIKSGLKVSVNTLKKIVDELGPTIDTLDLSNKKVKERISDGFINLLKQNITQASKIRPEDHISTKSLQEVIKKELATLSDKDTAIFSQVLGKRDFTAVESHVANLTENSVARVYNALSKNPEHQQVFAQYLNEPQTQNIFQSALQDSSKLNTLINQLTPVQLDNVSLEKFITKKREHLNELVEAADKGAENATERKSLKSEIDKYEEINSTLKERKSPTTENLIAKGASKDQSGYASAGESRGGNYDSITNTTYSEVPDGASRGPQPAPALPPRRVVPKTPPPIAPKPTNIPPPPPMPGSFAPPPPPPPMPGRSFAPLPTSSIQQTANPNEPKRTTQPNQINPTYTNELAAVVAARATIIASSTKTTSANVTTSQQQDSTEDQEREARIRNALAVQKEREFKKAAEATLVQDIQRKKRAEEASAKSKEYGVAQSTIRALRNAGADGKPVDFSAELNARLAARRRSSHDGRP